MIKGVTANPKGPRRGKIEISNLFSESIHDPHQLVLTIEPQGLILLKSSSVSGFLNTPILNCAVGKIAISAVYGRFRSVPTFSDEFEKDIGPPQLNNREEKS